MFSVYRNSILHDKDSLINPRLINRCVDKALETPLRNCFDSEPPFNRLLSEQPHIPVENIDVVRRELAYGNWALPKLYRQLHSKDPIVQLQAINSVCDLVHDPEKIFEAIRLKLVSRLVKLVSSKIRDDFKERILLALQTIAGQAIGSEEIIKRPQFLHELKEFLSDNNNNIRCKTAALIEMLSRSFTALCVLLDEFFVSTLLQYVTSETNEVMILHLQTLEKLFTQPCGNEQGIFNNGISKMVFLLEWPDTTVVSLACNCLAMLISNPEGKKIAEEKVLLNKLTELLLRKDRKVYTSAAEVIMFATHTVAAKHQAADIPGLADRLLELTDDFNHPPVQMFAMKALGNMVEHPDVRKKMLNNYKDDLNAIRVCNSQELVTYKEILLKLVNWKPWLG